MSDIEIKSAKNKYSKDFAIPIDFPEILTNLTREILRAQPQDIDKFALEYFEKEIEKQRDSSKASNTQQTS